MDLLLIKEAEGRKQYLKAMVAKLAHECPNHQKIRFRKKEKNEKKADSPTPPCKDAFGVFSPAFRSIGGDITDVSTRGKEVWVIKKDDSIHRFKNGQWQQIPGAAVNVGASPDGSAWVVNRGDAIYRFNTNSQNWEQMPGLLVQVSAISNGDALGVNRQTGIYLWKAGGWAPQPGLATWASIGQNDERWVIGLGSTIYRWNSQTDNWVQQPGAAVQVDVHGPNRIVVVNSVNQVYAWLPEQKNWKHLEGLVAKRATIGDGVLITLGVDGHLSALKH